jgi:hypothetical protein
MKHPTITLNLTHSMPEVIARLSEVIMFTKSKSSWKDLTAKLHEFYTSKDKDTEKAIL